jgi:hypothetical protein
LSCRGSTNAMSDSEEQIADSLLSDSIYHSKVNFDNTQRNLLLDNNLPSASKWLADAQLRFWRECMNCYEPYDASKNYPYNIKIVNPNMAELIKDQRENIWLNDLSNTWQADLFQKKSYCSQPALEAIIGSLPV